MSNIFSQIKFIWKRPKVIVLTGAGRECAKEAVFQVLKQNFRIGDDVLLFESDLKDKKEADKLNFLVRKSSLSILAVTHLGEIPFDRDYFAAEKEVTKEIMEFARNLPSRTLLILNFDDETVRETADVTNLKTLTFGFQDGADFRATDIKVNGGTNFKVNYKGNIVPVWLEGILDKEQIYSVLAAACVGTIFDLNLIEISQALKDYHPVPDKKDNH